MVSAETVKEMKDMIETLKAQVTDLNARLLKAEGEVMKGTKAEYEEKKKEIRGFDAKHMPRPEAYD